jgi:hypothetical protein
MSGVHSIFRATNTAVYTAASTTILLPDVVAYRSNDANYKNGAFFEVFHGFYKGNYGLDIGIIYDDKGFRLVCGSLAGTASSTWMDKDDNGNFLLLNAKPGDTVVLNTSLVNGYIKADCLKNGTLLNSISFYLNEAAYNTLLAGSYVNREICIAINKNAAGVIEPYGNCYFRKCKASKTTLTTASGTYVAMNSSNSNVTNNGKPDDPACLTSYADEITTNQMDGNFVWDQATATFNKRDWPISKIKTLPVQSK